MTKNQSALLCGVLFGLGLSLSQMNNPQKVMDFLDVSGQWDASLALVMGGALLVLTLAQRIILQKDKPVCDTQFHLPKPPQTIDRRLIVGSALFGLGWGLVGFCPGAVLAAWGSGSIEPFVFTAALGVGMVLFHRLGNAFKF